MHVTVRVVLALLPLLVAARPALAKCDPATEPDRSDVANARAAVAAACDCAGALSHRDYVRCAAAEAGAALVNKGCTGAVKHCASKSTCGKPGFVACCRTRASGTTSCALKRSAARCVAPKGGSACASSTPSCCDACDAGGCSATTTTTTSSTTTTSPVPPACGLDAGGACGGLCPLLQDDCVQDPVTGACGCVPGACRAIGGIGSCGGTCPAPATCTLFPVAGGCTCITFCAGNACTPPCLIGQACVFAPSAGECVCAP